MRLNKYPPSESTSVSTPDPMMLQRLADAQDAIDLRELEKRKAFEGPLGMYEADPAGLPTQDPLFEILSLGGPKLFSELGEAGVRQIAKFLSKTPKSELDKLAPKEIVMKALDPMEELADRRAKENLEYVTDRIVKQAGAEDSGALINLQSKSDALLDDAIQQEISQRISLANKVDDIFSQALVDDVAKVRDVGTAADVARINRGGYEVGGEYAKLFEDLGLTKDQAMNLIEERFMMDPDAVRLPLSAYGKQTQRLNRYGGVVPMKKAKKGMKIKKRYGR
jgi:hypothetical protein